MSRRLGDGYADLAALTGLINVAAAVANGAGTWLTRVFAHDAALHGEGPAVARLWRLLPRLGGALLALLALLAVLGPWIVGYLRLSSGQAYGWACATVATGLSMMAIRAMLQGLHRFKVLAASYLVEAAARPLLPAYLASVAGLAGALAGTALVPLLAFVCAVPLLWQHRRAVTVETEAESVAGPMRDTAAMALFSLVCFLDLFLFKHAYGADEGLVAMYSRAAVMGKSFLYLGSAVTLVALPALGKAKARREDLWPLLLRFMGALVAMQAAGLALLWAFTIPLLKLLVGDLPSLPQVAPLARWFALAAAPLALFQLTMLYALVTHARGMVTVMAVVTLAFVAALTWLADGPYGYVACLGACSMLLLVGGLFVARRSTAPVGKVMA
jgi:hypothetical protein